MIIKFVRFAATLPLFGLPIRLLVAIIKGPNTRKITIENTTNISEVKEIQRKHAVTLEALRASIKEISDKLNSTQANQLSTLLTSISELNHKHLTRNPNKPKANTTSHHQKPVYNISFVYGHCLKNDAINNAIAKEIEWLKSKPEYDVRLFAQSCERDGVNFTPAQTPFDIISDQFFLNSDLVVFHFGVYYENFNTLLATSNTSKKLVVFHNITPKEHLPSSSHQLIDKSLVQMSNMEFADHILCDSEFNLEFVKESGITTPCTTLALPLNATQCAPHHKPSFLDNVIRVIYIGRLVRSKGIMDLLWAIDSALKNVSCVHMKVNIVCNTRLSDPTIVDQASKFMEEMKNKHSNLHSITIDADATETHKENLLTDADIFVLPTMHEGFCVPILEAFNAGCRVISYENSNVPSISAGLATLVPTSDIRALSNAILSVISDIQKDSWKRGGGGYENFRAATNLYCRQFDPKIIQEKYLSFVDNLISGNANPS